MAGNKRIELLLRPVERKRPVVIDDVVLEQVTALRRRSAELQVELDAWVVGEITRRRTHVREIRKTCDLLGLPVLYLPRATDVPERVLTQLVNMLGSQADVTQASFWWRVLTRTIVGLSGETRRLIAFLEQVPRPYLLESPGEAVREVTPAQLLQSGAVAVHVRDAVFYDRFLLFGTDLLRPLPSQGVIGLLHTHPDETDYSVNDMQFLVHLRSALDAKFIVGMVATPSDLKVRVSKFRRYSQVTTSDSGVETDSHVAPGGAAAASGVMNPSRDRSP